MIEPLLERPPDALHHSESDSGAPSAPPLRIGFVSLGCPKNLVDSEVMMGLLDHAGARIVSDAQSADVLVVNTCSFIDSAKQESVDTILEMARHKTSNGGKAQKLIVAGCLVERYRDEIQKNIPEVDAVVGTGELESILAAAGLAPRTRARETSPFTILTTVVATGIHPTGVAAAAAPPVIVSPSIISRPEGNLRESQGRFSRHAWDGAHAQLPQYLYDEHTPRLRATPGASAYIKIAEGCDHPCSFCVIPNLRGKFRSRRVESVIAEARQLVAQGVSEITLIGQDTTCYGEDFGLKDGLAQLLDVLAQIEVGGRNIRWLRFLYAYPNKITGRLLDTIARRDNICKYLDVPLQHAAGSVLKRMKRGANADIFLKTLEKVRAAVPGIALRTSFIVGFPGETEQDFTELMDFAREARFDWMGAFAYSDEDGASSYALGEKVPPKLIEQRKRMLMRMQRSISKKARQKWVGQQFDLLVENESEETPLLWEGRTQFHAPEIDGKVYINDFGPFEQLQPGGFHKCEVTEAHEYDVVARIVSI